MPTELAVSPLPTRSGAPPSRSSNPFATCWTQTGALPYEPASTGTAEVIDRLRQSGWRGFVCGPHGAGKSTLLASLAEPLRQAGVDAETWRAAGPHPGGRLLLVEGFERLPFALATRRLVRWRLEGQPFLATVHSVPLAWRPFAAVVARLAPDRQLLGRLFHRLTADRPTPVTLADAEASFTRRRGNLREVWFDLYNRHEALLPSHRTGAVVASYE